MGSTGTKLQKEVAAMEEAMKQHHIEEQCQLLIDEMMPQIKRLGRSLSGTYHRNIIEYTTSRIKSPESIVEKLHRKNREVSLDKAVETLRDLAGIRVICSFQDDVYRVAGAIKNLPGYELVKEKNYINKPKRKCQVFLQHFFKKIFNIVYLLFIIYNDIIRLQLQLFLSSFLKKCIEKRLSSGSHFLYAPLSFILLIFPFH